MQRHGISRQLQPTASGSTPHNHVAIPQVCSSLSLPLDQPRQSAFRYPSDVANRPTTCAGRRHIPLIHRLLHRRAACWTDSIPFNQLTRGTQIPIAPAARPTSLTRGFLPWRLSDAGRRTRRVAPHAAGIRNPCMGRSLSRAIFILHISSLQFFCSARRSHSSAPAARSEGRRAQRRSRMAPSSGPPRQRRVASLMAASTTARCVGLGRHTSHRWFANPPPLVAASQSHRFDVMCDTASCSRR